MLCLTDLLTACEQDQEGTGSVLIQLTSCQQTCMTYITAVYTLKILEDGQMNCPKHVQFYSRNEFEKLVHLVGFIIRILNSVNFNCNLCN